MRRYFIMSKVVLKDWPGKSMLKYLHAEINIQVGQNKEKGGKGRGEESSVRKSDEDKDKFCSSGCPSSQLI